MDNRITVQELYNVLASQIEKGNGDKKIAIAEYFIENINEEWEQKQEEPYVIGFNAIYYGDVEYSNEEIQYIDAQILKDKLENPELWDPNKYKEILETSKHDEEIKKYLNYIAEKMNKEKDKFTVEIRDMIKEEVTRLKGELNDNLLIQYSDYLLECLEQI